MDLLRQTIRDAIGDAFVRDSFKVEKLTDTTLLVKPGEGWFDGLPILMRNGKDQLVSGTILTAGITPAGISISDDSTGDGKIITFNDSDTTPTDDYRIVLSVREEVITNVQDPFIKNANLTEDTAQKVRLNIRINIVSQSDQTETPIPYTNDTTDENLVNQIVVTPTPAGNGELITLTAVTGSEEVDGRDVELILRNDPGIGGGNPIPNGSTDQQAFFNGKLIDSVGNEFWVNAVFNDTVSTNVVLRIDKEVGQPNPEIINGSPFILQKRRVYATDDLNGNPQGKLFIPIADLVWDSADGIVHESSLTDLRKTMLAVSDYQETANAKFGLFLVNSGNISWDASTEELTWASDFLLVNPSGPNQSISAATAAMVDGGALAYEMNLVSGGAIEKGTLAINVTAAGITSTLDPVSLSNVRLGNVVKDSNGTVTYITGIDDVNNTITTDAALTGTGAATIYLDSYAEGYVPLDVKNFILAVRNGSKAYIGINDLELEDGETSQLGDGVSSQLLALFGASVTESITPPYPYSSTTIIADTDGFMEAISKLDAATTGVSTTTNEDRNLKLIGGGTWSWVVGTETLSWSASAFIQRPGFSDDRNEISAGSIVLNANEVAYVDVNRTTDSPTTLTVNKANINALTLTDNRLIIARRDGSNVIVGSSSFRLIDGQSKELDAGISIQNRTLLGTSVTEATSAPDYSGRGAPQRVILDSQGILDALASMDVELDKFFGQLQIDAHETDADKVRIRVADKTMLDSTVLSQELNNFLLSFDGAVIDFTTGEVFESDGTTPLGLDFTPFTIPVGEYFWYGLALLPATISADNRQLATVQVTPASAANAVDTSAPFPLIIGDKKLGAVQVQNNGGSIEVYSIRRLGVGSGSGGGSGDANSITETLKNRLLESDMELVTPNVFSIDQDDKLDGSSTAEFSFATRTLEFANALDEMISIQMLDSVEFLGTEQDISVIELMAFWTDGAVDDAATYEVSRDGGNEYQAVAMERVGTTGLYRGRLEFDEEAANQLLHENDLTTDDTTSVLDDGTASAKHSQAFTVTSDEVIKNLNMELNKLGTPLGAFRIKIIRDDGGSPSTDLADVIGCTGPQSITTLSAGVNSLAIDLGEIVLAPGTYHIVLETDLTYQNSYSTGVDEIGVRTASGSTPDSQIFDGTTWSASTDGAWVYELEGRTLDLRVKITSSTGDVSLDAYGIFYDQQATGSVVGIEEVDRVDFKAVADNLNEFTITKFLVNTDLLRIYYVQAGQVFRYPAFSVQGNKIIFDVDQFNNGGVEADVTLIFDQTQGGGFDNSDKNGLLLANNHLGSTDPAIDKSANGRGIFLKRPDGVMRELTIDNTDSIAIFSV